MKEFVLQFDVGTCLEAGADPIAWINANPGRIKSLHLRDWAPGDKADEKGYRVLFGEGVSPWKDIIAAAESVGGVEFYLMEQEGSRFSEFETAERGRKVDRLGHPRIPHRWRPEEKMGLTMDKPLL